MCKHKWIMFFLYFVFSPINNCIQFYLYVAAKYTCCLSSYRTNDEKIKDTRIFSSKRMISIFVVVIMFSIHANRKWIKGKRHAKNVEVDLCTTKQSWICVFFIFIFIHSFSLLRSISVDTIYTKFLICKIRRETML